MAQADLDRVVHLIQSLSPDERISLRDWLVEQIAIPSPTVTEEEFAEEMLRLGVLDQLPSGRDDGRFRAYTPVPVTGEPLSETILKERR